MEFWRWSWCLATVNTENILFYVGISPLWLFPIPTILNTFLVHSLNNWTFSFFQVFLTSDGRYAAAGPGRSRSPPRSTPPPTRPMISHPAISQMNAPPQLRQGGITSGKPIVSKAEIYRGPPEVTISKTSSPRGGGLGGYSEVANNPLASLVSYFICQYLISRIF